MIPTDYDIIVIGAGPSGISAAMEAAEHGASVCLLDEQRHAGGQIYRNVSKAGQTQVNILGKDYLAGRSLVDAFYKARIDHHAGVSVWNVEKDGIITYSDKNHAWQVKGQHIIVATGAIERPAPVPGWTLPGVMSVGAAQILMKSDGLVAQDAVLVGSGPLLYLVATQLLAAGAPPAALIETHTRDNLFAATPHVFGALKDWTQLLKGLSFLRQLRRAKIPRYTAATDITIEGVESAEAVNFRAAGKAHRIDAKLVLVHQGVVPNTQISRSLGLDHRYNVTQRCFHPVTDELGQSSHPLFTITGDSAGIGGATVAALSGRIGALNALTRIAGIDKTTYQSIMPGLLNARRSALSIRPFLDMLYSPPESIFLPTDDTIVCRCEEVTAGDIRRYAALGCAGPNRTKVYGRCGMGPCQGRNCGTTVTELLAAENNESQDTVGSFRVRAPLKPVTLSELAALSDTTDNLETSQ